ncbi:MAG: YhgE/Pip domain-containing protein [Actinomycetaceae bacterium]|nr:YhgE/Pip domain-containing protein [Arcanobacterium sp.]MDD7504604.1 YhgE/Pip domain-containing protein [Actinomycetaceae bacterium]MDY6143080.1 YhgE/Pip domain-containing protein [Arcanobacterium sp.]
MISTNTTKSRSKLMAVLVLVIPTFICLALLGANLGRVSTLGNPQAAIVNSDDPVTLQTGQMLPAGRQMIAALTDPARETNFEWSVVTSDTAASGLDDGTYDAVVTIPESFSSHVAGVLQSTSTAPGELIVSTSGESALIADLSDDIIQAAIDDLGTSFTVQYLTESLAATTQIRDGFTQASDGAAQLANGISQAEDGAAQLANGTDQLANGNTQLADGASQLAGGINELARGTVPLSQGAATLAGGLDQYIAGVSQAADGSVPLASGMDQFADGVEQYVGGVQQLYDGITKPQPGQSESLQSGAHQLADALSQMNSLLHQANDSLATIDPTALGISAATLEGLATGFDQLDSLISQCAAGNPAACQEATQGVSTTASALTKIAEQLSIAQQSIQENEADLQSFSQLLGAADQLTQGAQGLAGGIDTLAEQIQTNMLGENASTLTGGARQLADGVGELSAGLQLLKNNAPALSSGTHQLADGTRQLSGGANQAANGANQLAGGVQAAADGTRELAQGARQLADGQTQLRRGGATLADELRKAGEQIPTYTRSEAENTAQALGTPVVLNREAPEVSAESSLAPSIMAITLWIGALCAVVYFGAMRTDRVNSSLTPLRFTLNSITPALGFALAQGVLVLLGLLISGVEGSHPLALTILVLFVAGVTVAIHFALTAMFGMKAGVILSLLLLSLQLVVSGSVLNVASNSAFFEFIEATLPIPQAESAFRSALTDIGSMAMPLWMLVFWLILALIITVASVARRRNLSPKSLRRLARHYEKLEV